MVKAMNKTAQTIGPLIRKIDAYYKQGMIKSTVFQILTLSLVLIFNIKHKETTTMILSAVLVVFCVGSNLIISRFTSGDRYLLLIVNFLFTIGVVMVIRIEPAYGKRQLMMYCASLVLFFLIYLFLKYTHRFWEDKTLLFYGLTLATFAVTLVLGEDINGARNWVSIGSIQVQPSEFAKIGFIFFIASWFKHYEKYRAHRWLRYSLMAGTYVLIGMFFLQRELGSAVVFFVVLSSAQFAYEKNWKIILLNIVLAIIGLFAAYKLFYHVRVRFDIWLDPWQDVHDKGYQIVQSLFALAEGGFFGTGIGLGKPGLIPLGYSDFIFSAIVEEMGAFMGICVILLFFILVYRGVKIAMMQERDFYSCLALCTSVLFASQALIMFAGVMKLIPLTGITIPFMTYGGSSLVSSFVALAVLQVSSEDFVREAGNAKK